MLTIWNQQGYDLNLKLGFHGYFCGHLSRIKLDKGPYLPYPAYVFLPSRFETETKKGGSLSRADEVSYQCATCIVRRWSVTLVDQSIVDGAYPLSSSRKINAQIYALIFINNLMI